MGPLRTLIRTSAAALSPSVQVGLLGAEYLRKARTLDRTWLGTAPNQQGPVELHLRGHGAVRGVVFCSWAEASGDVDWLLSEAVAVGLSRRRHIRPCDYDEPDRMRSILAATLRRRWGMTALRANARLLLERLSYVGRGAMAAVGRRDSSRFRLYRHGNGPHIWGVRI